MGHLYPKEYGVKQTPHVIAGSATPTIELHIFYFFLSKNGRLQATYIVL